MAAKKKLTARKAKTILRENLVRGKEPTPKQKRFFGAIAGGQEPRLKKTGGKLLKGRKKGK